MDFLCAHHRERLQQADETELANYCVRWLSYGRCHREQNQSREALAYVGSAFDVASILMRRFPDSDSLVPILLTLATINLAFQLRECGRREHGERVIDLGCQRLAAYVDKQCPVWRECVQVLTDRPRWSDYVWFHLGFALAGSPRAVAARPSRGVPTVVAPTFSATVH